MGLFDNSKSKQMKQFKENMNKLPRRSVTCPYCGTSQMIIGAGSVTCRKCKNRFN